MSENKKLPNLVFIVEDDKMYAKALEKFLTTTFPGVQTEIFPVGEVCLDNLHRNPDLIIMDHVLNSRFHDAEDGVKMLYQIRVKNPKVKTIVLSAQEKLEVAVEAMEETKSHYVIKNDEAFQKIEKIIRNA